jgi:hypothetical protein
MRFVALGLVLLVGSGCNALRDSRCSPSAGPCGPGSPGACGAPGPQGAPCGLAPCQPPPQPCPPKAPEKPREVQPREVPGPTVERTAGKAAVTQDILLIPRMVYVPYAPQVPVAPARLGVTAPAERVITEQETTRETAPGTREGPTPPPRDRSVEALEKCSQLLECLEGRLRALEERQRLMCPPAPPGCPAPMPGPDLSQGCPALGTALPPIKPPGS